MEQESIDYVVDANVIMSMLISGRSYYRRIFRAYNLYSPDFVFSEIKNYQEVILEKRKIDDELLQEFGVSLFRNLCVIPELLVKNEAWEKAQFYCAGVDPKDVPYVALSISLNTPLLTRDKPLYTGLRKKGFRNVLLFNEFLALQ